MIGLKWRVTYTKRDELGVLHFTNDINAINAFDAAEAAHKLLLKYHPEDEHQFHLSLIMRIERRTGEPTKWETRDMDQSLRNSDES